MDNRFDTIGFIGAGNMAEAIMGGIIHTGLFSPTRIRISDIRKDHLKSLSDTHGVITVPDNASLFSESDIVILAVKPQQIETVLEALVKSPGFDVPRRKMIISIAAGCAVEKIERILYAGLTDQTIRNLPIIRVMPNTPALVGKGITGMCANRFSTETDLAAAGNIFQSVGRVLRFSEPELDAVTAMSGSGPAYVFYLAEAMIEAGKRLGLTSEASVSLTAATITGAAALLESQAPPPEELRRRVTSPGGTTEAAVKVFSERGVKEGIVEGIIAAERRARELR